MIRVTTSTAQIRVRDQAEMESLILHLMNKDYWALIRSMFANMLILAKWPRLDHQVITEMITQAPVSRLVRRARIPDVMGDIFFTDDTVYVLNPISTKTLQAWAIGYEKQKEGLQKFCADVEEGVKTKFDGRRVKGMDFAWKLPSARRLSKDIMPSYAASDRFYEDEPQSEETRLRFSKPDYSPEDLKKANLLVDTKIRNFILKLAQTGKMTSKDANTLAKKSDVPLRQLLSLGLIVEEYLLTCKQDQHTICIVPSKDQLAQDPMASLRCNVCDRPFPEENLRVIYTQTDGCKKLIRGSLWMSVWITELLKENGIRKESIKWGLEVSGEELDMLVEDCDSRLFLELKDREFGLGDAYPFTYRVNRYGGRLGVVATMDKVSPDAKKFFEEESQPVQIACLESKEGIQKGITRIVEALPLSQVTRLIQPFSTRMGLNFWPIVKHWINSRPQSKT